MRHGRHSPSDFLIPRYDRMRFNNPLNGLFRLSPFVEELDLPTDAGTLATPALDVDEDESSYEITLEVPGLRREDLDVRTIGRELTLRGEKRREESDSRRSHWSERRYGRFERTLTLPQDADVDGLEARFRDGVLRVTVPRTGPATGRSVDIG